MKILTNKLFILVLVFCVFVALLFFVLVLLSPGKDFTEFSKSKVGNVDQEILAEDKDVVEVRANLPEAYQVLQVPFFGFDRYKHDLQNGADFIARTITNYYDAPGLTPSQSRSTFQHSSSLVDIENFFTQRGYTYENYDLAKDNVEEVKELLVSHEGPLIIMGQKLYYDSYFLGDIIARSRIITGYDDNATANSDLFDQDQKGVFYVHDITLGYNFAIPYKNFVELNSTDGVRVVATKPDRISQTFLNKIAPNTPYPERTEAMKDSEVLRLKLVSSYIASLFGQGHEDQREKIAIAQELFLNSSILDKMHPVEVFDTGFYTATSYQIQGNTIRAFEILKDVVVPVAEPEMDFRVYGEWGPVSDPNWPNRHIDARILLGLLALSLEENTVYEQMRTEIKQFTNENDQELNERFLTWIENAPTYRLDNLRTQLQ